MYSPRYNITFMGLEKLHPFDAGKWGKVINFLKGKSPPRLASTSSISLFSPPPQTCIYLLHFFLLQVLITPLGPASASSIPVFITFLSAFSPQTASALLLKGLSRQAAKQEGPCFVFPPVRSSPCLPP